jgi:ketosteroid isomerase-like protein
MKKYFPLVILFALPVIFLASCGEKCSTKDLEALKQEIVKTEKEFETSVREKGIEEAFCFYADENAVIKRQNDTLIKGKQNIRNYYHKPLYKDAEITWTPDFVDVSTDGTLGYTYGRYTWKVRNKDGKTTEYYGVFHTVWKKQPDGTWRYVWD